MLPKFLPSVLVPNSQQSWLRESLDVVSGLNTLASGLGAP